MTTQEPNDFDHELAQIQTEVEQQETHERWLASITDETLRTADYKEPYPGYFEGDPRHPNFSAEDRYLMDHPGPDWRTKLDLRREPRRLNQWDDEQFNGGNVEPKKIPVSSVDEPAKPPTATIRFRPLTSRDTPPISWEEIETTSKIMGLYLCAVCRRNFALWPSERALRTTLLGVQLTAVIRAPFCCTNCRFFQFKIIQALGHEGWRPFWQAVLGIWEAEAPPNYPPLLWKATLLTRKAVRAVSARWGAS